MESYNIHDILKIQSSERLFNPAFHQYFSVNYVEDPDIIIRNDWRRTNKSNFNRQDIWFYGESYSDFVYYEDEILGQDDHILVDGLNQDTTTLEYRTLRFPDVVPGSRGSILDLVESVIDWKLLKKGYTTIHAASLSKDGRSILLAGFPNVGKTLSTLALLQKGWKYMGDDNGVISENGKIYAYPSTSSIGYHDFLKYIKPKAIGRLNYYKHLLRVYPMQFKLVERVFDYPEIYLPNIGFQQGNVAEGDITICLEIGERNIEEQTIEEMTTKIISSTDYSRPRLWQNPFFQIWSYFNSVDLDEAKDKERGIILDFLEHCDCYTASCQQRNWGEIIDEILLPVIEE